MQKDVFDILTVKIIQRQVDFSSLLRTFYVVSRMFYRYTHTVDHQGSSDKCMSIYHKSRKDQRLST